MDSSAIHLFFTILKSNWYNMCLFFSQLTIWTLIRRIHAYFPCFTENNKETKLQTWLYQNWSTPFCSSYLPYPIHHTIKIQGNNLYFSKLLIIKSHQTSKRSHIYSPIHVHMLNRDTHNRHKTLLHSYLSAYVTMICRIMAWATVYKHCRLIKRAQLDSTNLLVSLHFKISPLTVLLLLKSKHISFPNINNGEARYPLLNCYSLSHGCKFSNWTV